MGEASADGGQVSRAREVLTDAGLAPGVLARQAVIFGELFQLLDEWIDETRGPWDVIRKQLRVVGVTIRRKTSPNTGRWQQHAGWTSRLPVRSWLAEDDGSDRDERTRQALAEAVALVKYGRGKDGRRAIARATESS